MEHSGSSVFCHVEFSGHQDSSRSSDVSLLRMVFTFVYEIWNVLIILVSYSGQLTYHSVVLTS